MKRQWSGIFFVVSLLLVGCLFLLFGACGKKAERENRMAPPSPQATMKTADESMAARAGAIPEVDAATAMSEGPGQPIVSENLALRGRKLIREGDLRVKVKDVEETRLKLEQIVKEAGGFIANVEFQGSSGNRRLELTLRVPAEGFQAMINRIRPLGFIEEEKVNVTDVTDQYVDIDRRIKMKQQLVARVERLIQERSYQFKDLLDVERELERLQLETEELQGSLRGLDDRISLSTLRVYLYQEAGQVVVPPDSAFAPLLDTIENAGPNFKRSVRALAGFIGFFINLVVMLLPWLAFLGVFLGIVVLLVRRGKKNK